MLRLHPLDFGTMRSVLIETNKSFGDLERVNAEGMFPLMVDSRIGAHGQYKGVPI